MVTYELNQVENKIKEACNAPLGNKETKIEQMCGTGETARGAGPSSSWRLLCRLERRWHGVPLTFLVAGDRPLFTMLHLSQSPRKVENFFALFPDSSSVSHSQTRWGRKVNCAAAVRLSRLGVEA